ncbi:MAG TPA: alpha/beta hydrolase [Actinomycetota bacterium]|nr:alpha/beta hydrolase [Actinomycetota bacterium]
MATFVIVHGAWGGGWEWRSVADLLGGMGHRAFPVTLTGLGDRSHLSSRSVDLSTHRDDVVELVRWERLREVILVGHSYGGMVISVAAPQLGDRLRAMVYVDGFVPEDGQCETDLIDPAWVETMVTRPAAERGEGWLVPFPFPDDLDGYPADMAERYRASRHPLPTLTEPASVAGTPHVPVAFVHCIDKEPGTDAFLGSLDTARRRGWLELEIASGHDVQIEHPDEIARVLHDLSVRF